MSVSVCESVAVRVGLCGSLSGLHVSALSTPPGVQCSVHRGGGSSTINGGVLIAKTRMAGVAMSSMPTS